MSKMTVHGVILTEDTLSLRILYEKKGKYFVRSGKDKFRKGKVLPASYMSLFTQHGFRKVKEPLPVFLDAGEMLEGAKNFHLTQEGSVEFSASPY